jgi:hypothetical protein
MDDDHYLNRLVGWIMSQSDSETTAAMIEADLQYLDRRLQAVAKAGHKGAHAEVDRVSASRYVTGTYLILGDILRMRRLEAADAPSAEEGAIAAATEAVPVDTSEIREATADERVEPPSAAR